MGNASEIDVLKTIDGALSNLEDPEARNRVLSWAWNKFSTTPPPLVDDPSGVGKSRTGKSGVKKKPSGAKAKGKGKSKASLSLVKDLNFKPKGKKPFDEFIGTKKPSSYYEKSTISAYYLKHELSISAISANHIFTCFKHMNWRVPANLLNTLAYTASRYGWLDTSNREDIKVTTMGENLVEHDLLPKKDSKKK